MPTDDELLNERLAAIPPPNRKRDPKEECASPAQVALGSFVSLTSFDYIQWSAEPNETFRASGPRRETLPAGVYRINKDDRGLYFGRSRLIVDDLIELDDSASQRVIAGIRKFWSAKEQYVRRGIVYKRGVVLWGPAGSGKTATLNLLMQELVAVHDGIVVLVENPSWCSLGLQQLRRIESDRPLIVVYEDVEELIQHHGEHEILGMLDGENQVANVVNIATTNFPEMLGARILNRPSRFDERIFVDMPSSAARAKYLAHACRKESVSAGDLRRWVTETEGFSVAHLRELVVAVFCLGQDYEDVLERLRGMRVQLKGPREFGAGPAGFAAD